MNKITIECHGDGFILAVDGGSIECSTAAEVMSRVGHEMGMTFNKAQRQLFERMEAAEKVADRISSEAIELRNRLNDQSHELAAAKGELSATRGLLEDVQKMRDEQAKKLKEAEELEAFLRHFINSLMTENFRMTRAVVNWFVKEYGSELAG